MRPGQKLSGQIRHHAGVLRRVVLNGAHTLHKQAVAHGQRRGGIKIIGRRRQRHAAQSAQQIVEERLFDVGHALPQRLPAAGDSWDDWAGLFFGRRHIRIPFNSQCGWLR